jgi:predicted DNA binding CopG/RHH family protein
MNKNLNNFKDEKELIETLEREIENNEWVSVENKKKEKLTSLLKKGAESFNKRKKLISIRISQRDLELLKRKSLEIGIPYQTLISVLIHQYVEGKIKPEL